MNRSGSHRSDSITDSARGQEGQDMPLAYGERQEAILWIEEQRVKALCWALRRIEQRGKIEGRSV